MLPKKSQEVNVSEINEKVGSEKLPPLDAAQWKLLLEKVEEKKGKLTLQNPKIDTKFNQKHLAVGNLFKETEELIAIISKSIDTAKRNNQKSK